jgi:hypothetical protein
MTWTEARQVQRNLSERTSQAVQPCQVDRAMVVTSELDFGAVLRRHRRARGLTHEALAERRSAQP